MREAHHQSLLLPPHAMITLHLSSSPTGIVIRSASGLTPPIRATRIAVAKRDALSAQMLYDTCVREFAGAEVVLCRHGEALLRELHAEPVDLVVSGLTFADMDGIDLLEVLNERPRGTNVLIVSSRRDERSLLAFRSASSASFFDPVEENLLNLASVLRQAASGIRYITPGLRKILLGRQSIGVLDRHFTPKELQVFCLIADGCDDHEAAAHLALSSTTVHTHRRNIMRKLGVSTSSKLVYEAIRLGIVRIAPHGDVHRPRRDLMSPRDRVTLKPVPTRTVSETFGSTNAINDPAWQPVPL